MPRHRRTSSRYAVPSGMIRTFGGRPTQELFEDRFVREFQGIARAAKRKLELLNAAGRLEDLRVPPANRLEKLRGNLDGLHSIRINDQWRIIYRWVEKHAYDVRIVDYH